jgi:hypothetical protein
VDSAGLVIGLAAGHLQHDIPRAASAPSVPAVRATDAPEIRTLHAVATTFSEDEFLGQVEMAADSPGPGTALRPLHDVTPRAWEVTERAREVAREVSNEFVYEAAVFIDKP